MLLKHYVIMDLVDINTHERSGPSPSTKRSVNVAFRQQRHLFLILLHTQTHTHTHFISHWGVALVCDSVSCSQPKIKKLHTCLLTLTRSSKWGHTTHSFYIKQINNSWTQTITLCSVWDLWETCLKMCFRKQKQLKLV